VRHHVPLVHFSPGAVGFQPVRSLHFGLVHRGYHYSTENRQLAISLG